MFSYTLLLALYYLSHASIFLLLHSMQYFMYCTQDRPRTFQHVVTRPVRLGYYESHAMFYLLLTMLYFFYYTQFNISCIARLIVHVIRSYTYMSCATRESCIPCNVLSIYVIFLLLNSMQYFMYCWQDRARALEHAVKRHGR